MPHGLTTAPAIVIRVQNHHDGTSLDRFLTYVAGPQTLESSPESPCVIMLTEEVFTNASAESSPASLTSHLLAVPGIGSSTNNLFAVPGIRRSPAYLT